MIVHCQVKADNLLQSLFLATLPAAAPLLQVQCGSHRRQHNRRSVIKSWHATCFAPPAACSWLSTTIAHIIHSHVRLMSCQ